MKGKRKKKTQANKNKNCCWQQATTNCALSEGEIDLIFQLRKQPKGLRMYGGGVKEEGEGEGERVKTSANRKLSMQKAQKKQKKKGC